MVHELIKVLKKLRRECPWDRKQTLQSVRPLIKSEVFELDSAIQEKNIDKIVEELGDLLFLLLFVARILEEKKKIRFSKITKRIKDKLVRRHPHVFKGVKVKNIAEILKNWERIKQKEKKGKNYSILASVPEGLPALPKAQLVQERVARVGFDFSDYKGVLKKVGEEVTELKKEIESRRKPVRLRRISEEFGDLLFSLVNLARHLDIDAESSLEKATNKFIKRFMALEKDFLKNKKDLIKSSLKEKDRVWERVKTKSTFSG
jgi:MazG family protein